MNTSGKVEAELRAFFASALDTTYYSASRPGRFRERAPSTHWIGGWVGPKAGLDTREEKNLLYLPGNECYTALLPQLKVHSPYNWGGVTALKTR
jgi:hypothetical protein